MLVEAHNANEGVRITSVNEDKQAPELPASPDEIAARYKAVCDWADLSALQANLWLLEAYKNLIDGVRRAIDSVEAGMSTSRFLALRDLYLTPGHRLTQGDLQKRAKTTSGSVTRLMDALEQDGLIARQPSMTDRRTNYVELTTEGLDICRRLIPAVANYSIDVCAGLDGSSRERFVSLLKIFSQGIEQTIHRPQGADPK
jgi:DNA-binding MarR family transcriptional regulator